MFLVRWWYGPDPRQQLIDEMQQNPLFCRMKEPADLGFRKYPMIAQVQSQLLAVANTPYPKRKVYFATRLFDLLTTDESRAFVRHYHKFAKTVFEKIIELRNDNSLLLPLHLRQLFPSAPPLAECSEFSLNFIELPRNAGGAALPAA